MNSRVANSLQGERGGDSFFWEGGSRERVFGEIPDKGTRDFQGAGFFSVCWKISFLELQRERSQCLLLYFCENPWISPPPCKPMDETRKWVSNHCFSCL